MSSDNVLYINIIWLYVNIRYSIILGYEFL